MSTLAKQAMPNSPPAAAASHGRSSRKAASSASSPANTKNCATMSGTGYFANQICGSDTARSAAASSPVRMPPILAPKRNRPPRLKTANSGVTSGAPRAGNGLVEQRCQHGEQGREPGRDVGLGDVGDQEPAGKPRVAAGHVPRLAVQEQVFPGFGRDLPQQRVVEHEPARLGDFPPEAQVNGGIVAEYDAVVRRKVQHRAQQGDRAEGGDALRTDPGGLRRGAFSPEEADLHHEADDARGQQRRQQAEVELADLG